MGEEATNRIGRLEDGHLFELEQAMGLCQEGYAFGCWDRGGEGAQADPRILAKTKEWYVEKTGVSVGKGGGQGTVSLTGSI